MRSSYKLAALAVALGLALVASAATADTFAVTILSQNSSTITLGWTAQPGYGYLFSADGALVSRTYDASRTQVRFAKNASNSYDVDVIVKGANGHCCNPTPPPVDTTAPTVSLTAPASGATVSGAIQVLATASDNVGVTRVEFYRNGSLIDTDTTSPYGVSFNTTSVTNGTQTFGARAYDAAGNQASAPQVSVTVNNSSPPPAGGGKLLWSPPSLSNPTTLNVTNTNHSFSLDNSKDYIVKLPSTPLTVTGGLVLIGGRNVTIVGGEINRPTATDSIDGSYGIALYRQTGTVHIEGVWIHGVGIGQAILIAHTDSSSYNSVIQVENSRLESLHKVGTIHTDTIQSYGGPGKLRLYQNTLISNGVVIQTQPCDVGSARPNGWDYRRLNLVHQTADAYALWKNCTPWSEYHEDIWLKTNPNHVAASSHSAYAGGNCWPCWNPGGSWPITGEEMHLGLRPDGDFVPQGLAGIGYVSPGYQ